MDSLDLANELRKREKHKLIAAIITLVHFTDLEKEYVLEVMDKGD